MPTIDDIVAAYRAELAARERARTRELIAAYHRLWQRIEPRIAELTVAIERARGEGRPVLAALYERERLAVLQDEVIRELQRVTGRTYAEIVREQIHAGEVGTESAERLWREVIEAQGIFSTANVRLPRAAIEAMVGALTEGSPLRSLLAGLAPETWTLVRDALIEAVVLGRNPRAIAALVRDALNTSLTRALTIARTEILRAYRTSQLETYRETGVIKGWVWVAAVHSDRTCLSCVAMHGTWHPLDEPMSEHPRGRCSAAPALKGPDRDGYYREAPFGVPGPQWFEGLAASEQRDILGPSKWAAYKAGDIELSDLVSVRESSQWGMTRSVASLSEAQANASLRRMGPLSFNPDAIAESIVPKDWPDARVRDVARRIALGTDTAELKEQIARVLRGEPGSMDALLAVDKAIHGPQYEELYRGMGLTRANAERLLSKGGIFNVPDYASFSRSLRETEQIAFGYPNAVYASGETRDAVLVRLRGARGWDISELSMYPEQEEVLVVGNWRIIDAVRSDRTLWRYRNGWWEQSRMPVPVWDVIAEWIPPEVRALLEAEAR